MENLWVFIVRFFGLIIGISPFIRNILFHWGITEDKYPLTFSDGIFIIVGFVFVWGSNNFGIWANSLGVAIVKKIDKKN